MCVGMVLIVQVIPLTFMLRCCGIAVVEGSRMRSALGMMEKTALRFIIVVALKHTC